MFNFKKKNKDEYKGGVILLPYSSTNIEYGVLSFIDDKLRIISKEKAPEEFKKKLSYFKLSKTVSDSLFEYITNSYEYLEHIETPEIYSIRRISDNQIYSLHDRVRFSSGYGPLIRFIVNGSSLYICTGMSGTHQLHEIKRNLVETIVTE